MNYFNNGLYFINEMYLFYVFSTSCTLIPFNPCRFTSAVCPCTHPRIKQNSRGKNEEQKKKKNYKFLKSKEKLI